MDAATETTTSTTASETAPETPATTAPPPKAEPWYAKRRVSIRADHVAMLEPFIATEETRYYLHGIHVSPHPEKGVILAATNGHMLGSIHDEDGHADAAYICHFPKALMQAIKRKGNRLNFTQPGRVHFVGGTAHLTAEGFEGDPTVIGSFHLATVFAEPLDGTFPDWRRVIPTEIANPAPPVSVNSTYLEAFRRVGMLSYRKSPAVTIRPTGDGATPIIVQVDSVPEFFGVLMPMRGEAERPYSFPKWLGIAKNDNAPKVEESDPVTRLIAKVEKEWPSRLPDLRGLIDRYTGGVRLRLAERLLACESWPSGRSLGGIVKHVIEAEAAAAAVPAAAE